ncbi:spore gernimation protein [Actinomyces sp. 2119]|uniref:GerMN domain-containing protein n=1 Tax=Actinomyces sp. 2119 TaxID=2321393 RepID=UPI000E6BDEB4|nr:GerMN domain-containing protein [Actinomyces sp. 2119]RJF41491.1 spore gernimation protein [Actinomyces sp. 2119]
MASVSDRKPARRHLLQFGGVSAAAALLGSCTALPTSGEVHESDVAARDSSALIQTAPGPAQDATPEEIVRGFLRAAVAGFSDDFDTARKFLSQGAADQWSPLEVIEIYSGSTERQITVASDGSVTVTAGSYGRLGSNGVMTPARQDALYEGAYSLAKNSTGQWRIVQLPDGILLPYGRLTQHFAAHSLCFLSRDRSRFVPELRWFPRTRLARALVEGLIGGPSPWLASATTSLMPRNAGLTKEGVSIEDQVATVHLTSESDPGSSQGRGLLVAQVEQTLTAVGEISEVEVLAGATSLGQAQDLPALVPDVGGVIGMSGGAVVRGTGTTRSTLATAQALGVDDARWPSLGADGNVYALSDSSLLCLPRDRSAASVILSVGDPSAGAGGLGAPVADRHGWVWLLAEGYLTAVDAEGQRAVLEDSWVHGQELVAFDLSVESERLALRRSDGTVVLAAVLRDDSGRPVGLGDPLELPPAGGGSSSGMAWCSPTAVGFLVEAEEEGGVPQVRLAQVGGSVTTMVGVSGVVSVIADRSEETVLLADARGQTWQRRGATWRVLTEEVTDLAYALP